MSTKTHEIPIILILTVLMSSQLNAAAQEMSKNDYLEKSRRQKMAGYIMLGGGLAMATAGSVLFSENFILFGASDSEEQATGVGVAMVIAGGIAAAGSIPIFMSSAKNKKKQQNWLLTTCLPISRGLRESYRSLSHLSHYQSQLTMSRSIFNLAFIVIMLLGISSNAFG